MQNKIIESVAQYEKNLLQYLLITNEEDKICNDMSIYINHESMYNLL